MGASSNLLHRLSPMIIFAPHRTHPGPAALPLFSPLFCCVPKFLARFYLAQLMQPGNPQIPLIPPWSRQWFPHHPAETEVGGYYRNIWKWEPTAALTPGTKNSDQQKQKYVCPKELVSMVTSWPGNSELHRMLLAPQGQGPP